MKICISKSYETKKVFDGLTIDVTEGEILCVLGESGCGKTTLLNILAGLTSYKGELFGVPEKVGYIFQEPRLIPTLTVQENLRYVGGRDKEIDEVLQKVELLEKKNEYPDTLSGGEKQRVSIARAFLSNAALLLLDEPFSSLDTPLKIRLMQTFARLWQEKRQTVVFVTHDIEEALSVGHRILLIKDGKVCLDKTLEGQIPRNYGMQTEERKIVLQAIIE